MKAKPSEDRRSLVVPGAEARSLYSEGGYGRPTDDGLSLSPEEAVHLERVGKIEVESWPLRPDHAVATAYHDLRQRGYYLQHRTGETHLELYPRGTHPSSGDARDVEALHEDDDVALDADSLKAVVDDDGDVTYFEFEEWDVEGDVGTPAASHEAHAADVGYVVDEAADSPLHTQGGYGRPDGNHLVLSAEEAAYLVEDGGLEVENPPPSDADLYADLRDRGLCPRTGFKFGTRYRLYTEYADGEHSPYLLEPAPASLPAVEVSRAVRLAHGVRKTVVYALEAGEYVTVRRERP
ncbi:MAG: hypothetical protein ACOCT0_04185 [Halobacteriota archaeon]